MLFLYKCFASKAGVISSVKMMLCNYDVWFMTIYRRMYCHKIWLNPIGRSITTNICKCIKSGIRSCQNHTSMLHNNTWLQALNIKTMFYFLLKLFQLFRQRDISTAYFPLHSNGNWSEQLWKKIAEFKICNFVQKYFFNIELLHLTSSSTSLTLFNM